MTTLNETFPPPRGTDNPAVTGLLMMSGVIVIPLLLTVVGLARRAPQGQSDRPHEFTTTQSYHSSAD
jgi:hypothetical protein